MVPPPVQHAVGRSQGRRVSPLRAATTLPLCQAKNAPTPRSGHRMIAFKNMLLVFGGFFDNGNSVRYFNDLSARHVTPRPASHLQACVRPRRHDLESRSHRLRSFCESAALAARPSSFALLCRGQPRSGCVFVVNEAAGTAVLYGGYFTEVVKGVEKVPLLAVLHCQWSASMQGSPLADTWQLDLTTLTWTCIKTGSG